MHSTGGLNEIHSLREMDEKGPGPSIYPGAKSLFPSQEGRKGEACQHGESFAPSTETAGVGTSVGGGLQGPKGQGYLRVRKSEALLLQGVFTCELRTCVYSLCIH